MFAGTSLIARISITIAGLAIFATLLSGAVNYLKFVQVIRDQERSRYQFVLGDLKTTIEDSLTIGLPLPVLRNTQSLIQRTKASDAAITGITVFDQNGIRLFDTERGHGTAAPVDADWVQKARHNQQWSEDRPELLVEGAPIRDSLGQVIGGVVLRRSPADTQRMTSEILVKMVRVGLQVAIGASIASVLGVWLVLRATRAQLAADAARLEALLTGGRLEPAGDELVDAFEHRAQLVLAEIAEVDRGLGQIETTA